MNTPTKKQQAILDFIKGYRLAGGISPSTREIQEAFGFKSQTAAVNNLKALKAKGLIKFRDGVPRSVVPFGETISYPDGNSTTFGGPERCMYAKSSEMKYRPISKPVDAYQYTGHNAEEFEERFGGTSIEGGMLYIDAWQVALLPGDWLVIDGLPWGKVISDAHFKSRFEPVE